MKVLVCGGRDYDNGGLVSVTLSNIYRNEGPVTSLIHGDCSGADRLADAWAAFIEIERHIYPANWAKYGKRAGPIRNGEMLKEKPDLVVAFPGGKGTAHMVKLARTHGIEVREITENEHG